MADQSSSDSDPARDQPPTSSGGSQPITSQADERPTDKATKSTASTTSSTTTTTCTDTGGKEGADLPGESSGDLQTQSQASSASREVFYSSLSDEDEDDEDEDDDESEDGIPANGKYATSGTQTPYTKR